MAEPSVGLIRGPLSNPGDREPTPFRYLLRPVRTEPKRVIDPKPEWPVAFFDEDYLRIYRPQFTPERTAAETKFIADSLRAPAGGDVLDLACGFGRRGLSTSRR